MVIKFLEIEDGAVLTGEIDGLQYKTAGDEDFSFLSPIVYELRVKRFEDGVQLKGTIACDLSLLCSRCLDSFKYPVRSYMDIDITQKSVMHVEDEVELKGEELDVYFFENNEIDLNPLVYEDVLLNIPMKPLCMEECKGLCGLCGKNRNHEICSCNEKQETPFGEKLKSFLALQGDSYGSSKKKNVSVKKG